MFMMLHRTYAIGRPVSYGYNRHEKMRTLGSVAGTRTIDRSVLHTHSSDNCTLVPRMPADLFLRLRNY